MAGAGDRLAHVEGRFQEQTRMVDGIRESIAGLEERMGQRFDAVDGRFEAIDRRFDAVDGRFEAIDRRFDAVDRRFEAVDRRFEAADRRFDAVDRRFESTDAKISRQFYWLVGLQLTTLTAIVTALAAR